MEELTRLPIKDTVKAKGHTPQYRIHKYYARRPYNVFSNLIKHYTNKDDVILDCFCGGGVTIFEGLALDRRVVGVDINPLATFITEMQVKQYDIKNLKKLFYDFYEKIKKEYEYLYRTNVNNDEGIIEWVEWAYEVECIHCNSKIKLSSEYKISNGKYKCPNSQCISNQGNSIGVIRTQCKPFGSVPIRIKYKSLSTNNVIVHNLTEKESNAIKEQCDSIIIPDNLIQIDSEIPRNWDRWIEDCLPEKGINRFSDFFTKRNFYINTVIFNNIINMKHHTQSEYIDALYFVFSSSLRYTNNMTRVTDNWEGGNPTSMDKHAYWLPNQFVETNVFLKLKDRMKAALKGFEFTNNTLKNVKRKANTFEQLQKDRDYLILTQSSSSLPIPDGSISTVITDPPYGSNVQYGELSSFWNVWYMKYKGLDNFIYNEEEAVANRKSNFEGAKSIEFYGDMLYKIFKEANRVLKDDGYLVFTFNNKNINVWVQLLKAVVKAGFYLPEGGVIYQDFVKQYKNTSHLRYSGNIHGDFIYSFKKGKVKYNKDLIQKNYEDYLIEKIGICISNLYKVKKEYTTTALYENIFSELVNIIMQFISINEELEDHEIERIENLSNTFIDDVISQQLVMVDNSWVMRGANND